MNRLYGWQAGIYDLTRAPLLLGRRRLIRELAPSTGEAILDVGCGTGHSLRALADSVGPTGRVVAVDCVQSMASRAKRRVRACANVEIVTGDILDLPRNQEFDVATISYSLTLMPNWREVLDVVASLMRPPSARIGVVDFQGRPPAPVRWAFEAHGIEFGAERQQYLETLTAVRSQSVHSAYGLWRYFVHTGQVLALS